MKLLFSTLFFLLSLCVTAQTQWSAIMTQGTAAQTYKDFYSIENASSYINDQIKKDYVPTEIVYGDGKWYVVTTQTAKQNTISWTWAKDFPSDWINTEWNKGKYVTKITYGDGQWFAIMTTDNSFKTQSWGTRTTWDKMKQYIDEKWKENSRYNITDLAYGDGMWVVIISVMENYEQQKIKVSETFPTSWIQEQYDDKYNITSIENDGKQWYIVMTKQATSKGETAFNPQSAFPTSKIKEHWDKGNRISSLLFFSKAEENNTALFDKYQKAGDDYLNDKYYHLAIAEYKKAIAINAIDGGVRNNMAWAQYLAGYCTDALETIDWSLALEKTRFNNHTKASILMCKNRCDEAIKYYDEAIRICKQDYGKITESYYYSDRAKAKKCMRNYSGAKDDLQEAIKIDPNDVTLKNALIEIYELMNK